MRKIFVFFLFLCVLLSGCRGEDPEFLSVMTVFDVGQGQAVLFETEDGAVLVDAGGENEQEQLVLQLKHRGIKELRLAVFTHPDEDHIGGGDLILAEFPTEEVWLNGEGADNDSERRLRSLLLEKSIPVTIAKEGTSARIGNFLFTVFHSFDGFADNNANSIVLKVFYNGTAILLMGDADQVVERTLLQNYPRDQLRSDILLVGHHGSNNASGSDFLHTVSPKTALISCKEGNEYGHPDGRVLERLSEVGAVVQRTDLCGNISIAFYDNRYEIVSDERKK